MKIIKISVEKKARVSGLAFKVSGWNGCWLQAASRAYRATARLLSTADRIPGFGFKVSGSARR